MVVASWHSGWNLWVRLECIGVVSRCCKEVYVYRFPHNITYSYSTCISFLQHHPYFFVQFLNVLCSCLFLCNIANIAQRIFQIVQKSRSHELVI